MIKTEAVRKLGVWTVVDEADRVQWEMLAGEGVGPLRFGMSHDEAAASVADVLSPVSTRGGYGSPAASSEFSLVGTSVAPAVTTYYEAGSLACVAVNALRGPQITLDGLRLVGRVPSILEDAFTEYTSTNGHDLRYSQHADPGSETLGVVLRAQRAGDVVLSRPVLVAPIWAERCCDVTEGCIPTEEWRDRVW
ncbi:hypothetical protein [Streptomyces cadmiisoli]|uniref:hypothetical protein n=1 Tax=Streptomyces cadmiisoli TaxID=2184053 RepID=UPI001FECE35C|nr:hypothetical protein [Streptomyces cadmiisoli]